MRKHLSQVPHPPPIKSTTFAHGMRDPKKHPANLKHIEIVIQEPTVKPKHLLFFVGFGLKFQGVECPFHSLG